MWRSSSSRSRSHGSCRTKKRWRVIQPASNPRWHHEHTSMALTTDDQIEIDVHDDAAAMTHLLSLPAPARMDALAAMRGFSAFDEAQMKVLKQIHEEGDGF